MRIDLRQRPGLVRSGKESLFMFKALQTGLAIDIDLYTGSSDALETYVYTIETISEDTQGWTLAPP